jgi:hypothetical protein
MPNGFMLTGVLTAVRLEDQSTFTAVKAATRFVVNARAARL